MEQRPEPPRSRPRTDWDAWDLPEEPSPLGRPAPALAAVGAAIVVCGVVLPWVNYGSSSWVDGFGVDVWGVTALGLAGSLPLVLRSRSAMDDDVLLLQLLPAGLGLLSVLVAINAQQSAQALVDSYRGHGISAYPAIGLTFLMFGAVLCAIGGIGSTVMAWRPDGGDGSGQGEDERIERNEPGKRGGPDEVEPPPVPHPSPSGRLEGDPGLGFVLELVVGAFVSLAFAIASGAAALAVIGAAAAASLLMVVVMLSLLGGLAGAVLTDRLWRRFVSRS